MAIIIVINLLHLKQLISQYISISYVYSDCSRDRVKVFCMLVSLCLCMFESLVKLRQTTVPLIIVYLHGPI